MRSLWLSTPIRSKTLWTPAAARTISRRPRSTCGRVAADQRDTAFAPRRRVGRDRLRPTARGSKKLGRGLNVLREHRWDDKTYERHVKLNLRWVEESLEEFRAAKRKVPKALVLSGNEPFQFDRLDFFW